MNKKNFNIIDILAILVVIAIIAAVAFVISGKPQIIQQPSTTVILEVKDKTEKFCSYPQSGDTIWDVDTKVEIGKVISKETKPATGDLTSMEDEIVVNSSIPDKVNLYLTLEVHGLSSPPRVGANLNIQGRKYVCTGHIVEIPNSKEVSK